MGWKRSEPVRWSFWIIASQAACCSGVRSATSSNEKLERASCGGLLGTGWVGHAVSLASGDFGTGVSVTPKIGSPVTRFKMNSSASLFITAMAGMCLPSFFTSSSTGGVSRS